MPRRTPSLHTVLLFLLLILPAASLRAQQPATRDFIRVPFKENAASHKRALVIGISDYKDANPLRFTVNDAARFGEFLVRSWGFESRNVVLMTDDAKDPKLVPTRDNLRREVDALIAAVNEESDVVVFFSGHGVRLGIKDYIVPLDGEPRRIEQTCVSSTDLRSSLEGKRPGRAVLFIDACRDEATAASQARSAARVAARPASRQFAEVYSCEPGEQSREGNPSHFRNGVFTKFLLDGLGGDRDAANEDGTVTFDSLVRYVRAKVYSYCVREFASPQSPFGITSSGTMVLARAFEPMKPEPSLADRKAAVRGLLEQAYRLLAVGKGAEAGEKATEALKTDPDSADARFILGCVYLAGDRPDDALRELGLAKKLEPDLTGLDEKLIQAQRKRDGGGMADLTEGSAGAVARQAEQLLDAGSFKQAEVLAGLVLFIRKDALPADKARAHAVMGRILEQQNKPKEALVEFQESVRLQPDLAPSVEGLKRLQRQAPPLDVAAAANEAVRLAGEGRWSEAETRAREVLAVEAENERAHYVLGRVLLAQGRPDEAIRELYRVLARDPTFVDAERALLEAQVRRQEGDLLASARQAQQLLLDGKPAEAEAKAKAVLERRGQSAAANGLAHFVLGRVAFDRRKYEDALREYQEALRLEPGREEARQGLEQVVRARGEADVTALIDEAARLLEQGKLPDAETRAREAIARTPGAARAHLVLGQVFVAQKRPDDALPELQEARRLDPGLAAAEAAVESLRREHGRGAARTLAAEAHQYLSHDDWAAAISRARAAVLQDPENARAHAVLAYALHWLSDETGADQEIALAAALEPGMALVEVARGMKPFVKAQHLWNDAETHRLIGEPQQATRLEGDAMKLYSEAEQSFKKAVLLDRSEFLAFDNLGNIYFQQKRYPEALDVFQRTVAIRPDYPVAHHNLGAACMLLRRWEQAEQEFRAAIQLRSDVGRYHAALAGALWMRKKKPEAVAEARTAIEQGWLSDWVYAEMLKDGQKLR